MVVDTESAKSQVVGNGKDIPARVVGPFKFDKCGLIENIDRVTLDEWKYAGKQLRPDAGWPWVIGDWLTLGENREFISSQNYDHAEEITGLDHGTLKNYAYVARRVERNVRRDDLSWAHHQAVAAFISEKQGRWLEQAAQGKWTVRKLRVKIGESRKQHDAIPDTPSTITDHVERAGAELTIYDLCKHIPDLGEYVNAPDDYIVTRITSRKPKKGDASWPLSEEEEEEALISPSDREKDAPGQVICPEDPLVGDEKLLEI